MTQALSSKTKIQLYKKKFIHKLYDSLGVPVNFRSDDVARPAPVSLLEYPAELDLGLGPAVRLAQVEHVDAALVGQCHNRLGVLLAVRGVRTAERRPRA